MSATERWAQLLNDWAIPDQILAMAATSPWEHAVATFEVADLPDRTLLSARVAGDIVPPGGSVLDVGCGGGRAAMALVPPASHVIGVDANAEMLDAFATAARRLGASSETIFGTWPVVEAKTPPADVVVCHHVAYNVAAIKPFVAALTAHARVGVVVVLPVVHPMSCWNRAWAHFWKLERPVGPTSDDFVAVLDGLGVSAERWEMDRPDQSGPAVDLRARAADACRRLCLDPNRLDEVMEYLDTDEPDWVRTDTVLRWTVPAPSDILASPSGG